MHEKPLISIITVCFNSDSTIRETIESVLNQTYSNIEYIVIDGNSRDNTLSIIREYESRFAIKGIPYRYISEPDRGIYDAMNKGIKMATGEWVGLLNSDDWYELDACENIIKNSAGYDLIHGIARFLGGDSAIKKIEGIHHSCWLKDGFCHQAIIMKKNIYDELGMYSLEYKISADLDFLAKVYLSGKFRLKLIEAIVVNYRLTGLSTVKYIDTALEMLQIKFRYQTINKSNYYLKRLYHYLRKCGNKFLSFRKK